MSLTDCKEPIDAEAVVSATLRLLWRHWTALGVSGEESADSGASTIIDPEALLIATFRLGRRDPRLFDEALDWCALSDNSALLSLQRLKTLARAAAKEDDTLPSVLAAVAATLDAKDSRGRWRAPATSATLTASPTRRVLFRELVSGEPLPVFGALDPLFIRYGLARSPIEWRGLSCAAPLRESPSCLLLRLRSLFGIGPRAEICAYLLGNRGQATRGAQEIARATGYSAPAIYDALGSLEAGGFTATGGKGVVALPVGAWKRFLLEGNYSGSASADMSLPAWVDWTPIYAALSQIVEHVLPALYALNDAKSEPARSDYLRASRLLRIYDSLRTLLVGVRGLNDDTNEKPPFSKPATIDNAEDALQSGVSNLLFLLSL